jgi:hypothetical protein
MGYRGFYSGFDVLTAHIEWLDSSFADVLGRTRYTFRRLDILNQRYNPSGKLIDEIDFPFASDSFDCVTTVSVFTHMLEEDVRQYLRRIGGFLREGGIWITTFFQGSTGPCSGYAANWRSICVNR